VKGASEQEQSLVMKMTDNLEELLRCAELILDARADFSFGAIMGELDAVIELNLILEDLNATHS
jgi:hypothetical protein